MKKGEALRQEEQNQYFKNYDEPGTLLDNLVKNLQLVRMWQSLDQRQDQSVVSRGYRSK